MIQFQTAVTQDCRITSHSLRHYLPEEAERLGMEGRGLLLYLEQIGILDPATREIVIDRVMALDLKEGDDANLVLFGEGQGNWSTRRSVAEAVYLYDHGRRRVACLDGRITNGSR